VRPSVLFALEVKARNVAKDVEPDGRVATDLDLRLDRSKRVERLIQQIAHDAGLGLLARGADVVDGQVVVHPQVALDESGDLPLVGGAIESLEDEDVAAAGGAAIAFAAALLIGVGQSCADSVAQGRGVIRIGGADAVRQTSLFHGASRRTA
jgi:hypothetical protein